MAKRLTIVVAATIIIAVLGLASYIVLVPQGKAPRSFELRVIEFAFQGQGYTDFKGGPTIRVKVGDTVKVTVRNDGVIDHEFMVVSEEDFRMITQENMSMPEKHEEMSVFNGSMIELMPKETKSTTFIVDKAGRFVYACLEETPQLHAKLGMFSDFIVEAA